MENRPLLLLSNDDGVQAKGLQELVKTLRPLADLVVVAPDGPRSGASAAITSEFPLRLTLLNNEPGLTVYQCNGTPVDCVKLALHAVMPRRPDLVVGGINHGDNASVSLHYSGTMGAVLEACMKGVPAIGYSLRTRDPECDFSPYRDVVVRVARHVLREGLREDVCLNVNFPQVPALSGVSVCRMARGIWQSEWVEDAEPGTYRLTGFFTNLEPDASDTDYWALDHGMASVTPLTLDMTSYGDMEGLKSLRE